MNKTSVRTIGVGLLLLINLLLVMFLIFGRSGGRETVQDFVVAPTPTVPPAPSEPTATPMQKRLGTTFGAISLDMSEDDVLKTLGRPQERTIAPGNGSPEWRYTYVTLYGAKVWRIMANAGFPGATAEGFKLGDSRQTFKQIYAPFGVNDNFEQRRIIIKDNSGISLQVNFDVSGKAISLLLEKDLARSTQR